MTRRYKLEVVAESSGMDGEHISYHLALKNGREVLDESPARNITELGSKVISTLRQYGERPVLLKTSGEFYHSGEQMIRDIVRLYNNPQAKK